MGTRSTVKFYEDGNPILSLYQQYDGYVGGVGQQIAELFKKYQIVNGVGDVGMANGFSELALFYLIDNKKGNGNIYATHEKDMQEFNYEINASFGSSDIYVTVKEGRDVIFDGLVNDFVEYVDAHIF